MGQCFSFFAEARAQHQQTQLQLQLMLQAIEELSVLLRQLNKHQENQMWNLTESLQKHSNMELRQSTDGDSPGEQLRHTDSYYQGARWCCQTSQFIALSEHIQRRVRELMARGQIHLDPVFSSGPCLPLHQGIFAIEADLRRRRYQVVQHWLQRHRALKVFESEPENDWQQGLVQFWLPEFQAEMIHHGVPAATFEAFKDLEWGGWDHDRLRSITIDYDRLRSMPID